MKTKLDVSVGEFQHWISSGENVGRTLGQLFAEANSLFPLDYSVPGPRSLDDDAHIHGGSSHPN